MPAAVVNVWNPLGVSAATAAAAVASPNELNGASVSIIAVKNVGEKWGLPDTVLEAGGLSIGDAVVVIVVIAMIATVIDMVKTERRIFLFQFVVSGMRE